MRLNATGEAKIGELDSSVLQFSGRQEQVLRLQVAMNDVIGVEKLQPAHHILEQVLRDRLIDGASALENLREISAFGKLRTIQVWVSLC